ncbi:MAG: hypothetical protein AAB426_06100, partial [Myxococcota bacterium]
VFAKDRYQVLVLDSCKSEPYYRKRITEDAARYSGKSETTLDLITTNTDALTSDSIPTKLRVVLDFMEGKTAPEIERHLNTGTSTRYNTTGLFVQTDAETKLDNHLRHRGYRAPAGVWGRFTRWIGVG